MSKTTAKQIYKMLGDGEYIVTSMNLNASIHDYNADELCEEIQEKLEEAYNIELDEDVICKICENVLEGFHMEES